MQKTKIKTKNVVLYLKQFITETELNLKIFDCKYDIDVIIIDTLFVKSFEQIELNLPITLKALVVKRIELISTLKAFYIYFVNDYSCNAVCEESFNILQAVSKKIKIPFACKLLHTIDEYKTWLYCENENNKLSELEKLEKLEIELNNTKHCYMNIKNIYE